MHIGGSIADIIHQMVGGLRSSMGYLGSKDIPTFQATAEFVEITSAGLKESLMFMMLQLQTKLQTTISKRGL